jgi:predicted metal-dependent enzyme (double-stranded beta helix superfamily)
VRETVSVAGFMVQARSMLTGGVTEDSLRSVGRLLGKASREAGFVEEREMRALHGADSSFTVLQTDPDGLTLMLARFSPHEETPVHDHSSWGVACVVKGRDRYRHWELGEDGRLRLLYETELEPGSFVTWLDPPHDIHSQQGIGDDALELVLFGKNVTTIARHYYDTATGQVKTALPR